MPRASSVLLGLLAAGAPAGLHAQAEGGLKLGASFGNISNKGRLPGELYSRIGIAGGLYLGYHWGTLGIGVEGLYAQRGAKSHEQFPTPGPPETRLDYIDVPAYVKFTAPTSPVRPFVYAGPQVSFEVRCQFAFGGAACTESRISAHRTTDYAAIIGAGARLGGFGIEVRYIYGLRDLNVEVVTDPYSYKTRSFLLLASVAWP